MNSTILVLIGVKLYSPIPFPLLQMTPLILITVSLATENKTFRVMLLPLVLLANNDCAAVLRLHGSKCHLRGSFFTKARKIYYSICAVQLRGFTYFYRLPGHFMIVIRNIGTSLFSYYNCISLSNRDLSTIVIPFARR